MGKGESCEVWHDPTPEQWSAHGTKPRTRRRVSTPALPLTLARTGNPYPKVDKGNPYLVAAYTGHVVDSLPWGRGWRAPKVGRRRRAPAAAGGAAAGAG